MVKAISGVMTVRFKNELVRNITIKLGYANAKVRLPFSAYMYTRAVVSILDLQMRERSMPKTRELQILSF